MLSRIVAAAHYLIQQGPRIALFRARYALSKKTGRLAKRFPAYRWSDRPLSYWVRHGVPTEPAEYRRYRESLDRRFFFPPGQPPSIEPRWLTGVVEQADQIRRGKFTYFSADQASLGDPPDWLLNPFTKRRADLHHWTQRGDFDSQLGDIKYIWEPSRFGWVYTLARAYAATGSEDYPACFWRFFESWCKSNPPQCGPNWQCGQEIALRTMASLWGLQAFWSSPHSTDQRISMFSAFVAASAERIAGNVDFARALRNNHTISEAAGLYTVGVLFPEFEQADRWRAMGKSLLDGECLDQFYADGSYIQHSLNYQRLVLQVYTWVVRLAELNGDSFTANTSSLLDRSVRFLWNVQDEKSGCAPNYGHNDGALVLPLNSCGYLDYRPAIGAMHYALHARRLYDPGPWDEDLQWLFGESSSRPAAQDAGSTDHSPASVQACDGGYYTLRGRESWAMVRCHTYRDRPVQADMLHMDLWWRGLNILRDSGTYRYNCDQPWLDYFQGTSAHNTVVVNGQDQMRRSGHFMWLHWTRSTVRYHQQLADGEIEYWEGQHESYRRQPGGIIHRRAITRVGDHFWVVIDDLLGSGSHGLELYWHLIDGPVESTSYGARITSEAGPISITILSTPGDADVSVERGRIEPSPRGWQSLHYGERTPAPTLCATYHGLVPARFVTVLALESTGEVDMETDGRRLAWANVDGASAWQLELSGGQRDGVDRPIVTKVHVEERSAAIDIDRRFAGRFWPGLEAHT